MDGYIAGAERLVDDRVAYAKANGLSPRVGATYRLPAAPWRKVWHTVEAPEDNPDTPADEGWELDQIRTHAVRHRTPPHLWAAPEHDWVGQTVPLDLSAYALRHESGDPETNHAHAIQTEVIGYAKDGPLRGDVADWLGERVLAPILAAGAPVTPFVVAPSTGADGYGLDGKVRMSWGQWANFGGQCGHANVPGQQHWDPGVADYLRIARAIDQEDFDMRTDDQIKDLFRRVLNEGTGKGQETWAGTSKATLGTVQTLYNQTNRVLAAVGRVDDDVIAGLSVELAPLLAAELRARLNVTVDEALVVEALKRALREGTVD